MFKALSRLTHRLQQVRGDTLPGGVARRGPCPRQQGLEGRAADLLVQVPRQARQRLRQEAQRLLDAALQGVQVALRAQRRPEDAADLPRAASRTTRRASE